MFSNTGGTWPSAHQLEALLFHRQVMSDSLWPHELKHSRLPCPALSPWAWPSSCPLGQWCHLTISSSVIPFSTCPQSPTIRVFSNESSLLIRWQKYWSFIFSISLSSEYSGLISWRIGWFDLLAVQGLGMCKSQAIVTTLAKTQPRKL